MGVAISDAHQEWKRAIGVSPLPRGSIVGEDQNRVSMGLRHLQLLLRHQHVPRKVGEGHTA